MEKREYTHVIHTFEPIFDKNSKILILGSFPSVRSRAQNFYYGNPQNRFWKVVAGMTGERVPDTIEEKKALLLHHSIAIWDVIASCDIIGSSDSTIRNVVVNDFLWLLRESSIEAIYGNGGKAYSLYQKYAFPITGIAMEKLPSTSPANAAWSLEKLIACWSDTIFRDAVQGQGQP